MLSNLIPLVLIAGTFANPISQTLPNPSTGCSKLLSLTTDCSVQAKALFPADVNAQDTEVLRCEIDNIVAIPRPLRISNNITFPIELIKPAGAKLDDSDLILFNDPPTGTPIPFAGTLFTLTGQPNGNSYADSFTFWRGNGYTARVRGILTLGYADILGDLFTNASQLPVVNATTVDNFIIANYPKYKITQTGLLCR